MPGDSGEDDTPTTTPRTIFASRASYHPAVCLLIALGPLSLVPNLITGLRDGRKEGVFYILWSALALIIVFSLVLPRRYEILSNASLRVVTVLGVAWTFGGVSEARLDDNICSEWHRPKFKFAVNLRNRVRIRRTEAAWDVLVTPQDAVGLVRAVRQVTPAAEESLTETLMDE